MKHRTQQPFRLITKPATNKKGFTLIELLIAIAIVSILVAIAVPSYQEQVRKSNRKAAATCLTEYAQFMERFYTTNLTYVGAAPGTLGCATDLATRYTFGLNGAATLNTYSLRATAIGGQVKDLKCLNLSVNQTGQRSVSGSSSATPTDCWSK
jgi:type IV pilus assembly protein PilE